MVTILGEEYIDIYDADIVKALQVTNTATKEAAFMPELLDLRISADMYSRIWGCDYTTQSIVVIGRTRAGNAVVVYAHVPNYFSNPENITTAKAQGLFNSAGEMPQEEFYKLLDLEDNENVFVVDYNLLRNSSSGAIPIENALEHPLIIPFLGGRERAEKYLSKLKEFNYKLGVSFRDDLNIKPLGRILFVGNQFNVSFVGANFNGYGRFLQVKRSKAKSRIEEFFDRHKATIITQDKIVDDKTNKTIENIVNDFKARGLDEKELREVLESVVKEQSFTFNGRAYIIVPKPEVKDGK